MPVRLARTLATIALFLTTATLGVALAGAAASSSGITYVQSAAFGTGSKVASTQVQLSKPILAGDLLVGWFSQYNAAGNVRVSDSVNGTWTRAPGSLMFGTSGDNALYYVQNSAASATGVKITVTAPAAAYLQGAVSNYRGTATSAALDQIAVAKGVSKAMSTGPTFGVVAGELVFSAMITGGSPGGVVAGSSAGIPYTARASTSSGSVFAEDITAGAGAAQVGSATLKNSTDWYAVVATFHAAPAAAVAPSVPVGLVSTSVTAAAVGLSWSASTDNVPVTGYTVFRGGVSVGTSVATSFSDTSVLASTAYSYTVAAMNGAGQSSAQSAALAVTTPAGAAVAPSVPVGLVSTSVTAAAVGLSWSASTDNVPVTGYTVFRGGVSVGTSVGTSFSDTSVLASTAYSYTVAAMNGAGQSSAQSAALAVTTPAGAAVAPSVPVGLVSTSVTAAAVGLSWSASTDNVPVTGYTVFRGGVSVGTSVGTSFSDTSVLASTAYSYTVAAMNGAGQSSAQSAALAVTTPAGAAVAPSVPVGLVSTSVTAAAVGLSWSASTDNVPVTGYTVFRGGVSVGTSVATSFSDTSVLASTAYSYTVAAMNGAGQSSAQSAALAVTTPAGAAVAPSVPVGLVSTSVTAAAVGLSWSASTDNVPVTGYTVFRGGVSVGTSVATSFSDTSVLASTAYSYTVAAMNGAGQSSAQSAALAVTTPAGAAVAPSVPVGLVSTSVTAAAVGLSWSASTDNVPVTGYTVFRGGVSVGTSVGTSFSDTSVLASTAYSYTVAAMNGAGQSSAQSAALAVTTPAGAAVAPSVPVGLVSTSVTAAAVGLSWSASTDNVPVTGYTVFRGGVSVGTSVATSFSDTSVLASTAYSYTVAAMNGAGQSSAQSAALAVTTPAPAGCSAATLIAAVAAANAASGGGTVTLQNGCLYTLTAADNSTDGGTGLPVITGVVTVQGNGATIARSSAAGTPHFRMFDVASGGSLTVNAVTFTGGIADNGQDGGGAIYNHGMLAVSASTFTSNTSEATSGTSGGAINNSGTMTVTTSNFNANIAMEGGGVFNQNTSTITQSTFTNNAATIYGGGAILNAFGTTTVDGSTFVGNTGPGGGVVDNDTTINISNSTFFNNTGGNHGGGAIQNFGIANITTSTLSGNSSPYGSDIYNYGSSTATVSSSIVADGLSSGNCGGTPIIDGGYNLDTGSSCGFTASKNSKSNTRPQLQPLASNGGPTQTMALTPGSPAINVIPAAVSGCAGTTDQRGTARPQGPACDIGAYEQVSISNDTQPPTTPTGLATTSTGTGNVILGWNAASDNVGVVGYTVYRDGVAQGTIGGSVTSFTDSTAASATTYAYTVDAFDAAGNRSPQSAPLSVTTTTGPPPSPHWIQGAVAGSGSKVASLTLQLNPVTAGDLLVGWFGQYDSAGPVQVSDDVNGAWTRAAPSTTFSSGAGDIALFYVQNAAAAPGGVTVTIASTAATYLQGSAAEYAGVARTNSLDQMAIGHGTSAAADSSPTGSVAAGELLFSGLMTGAAPGTAAVNNGLVSHDHNGSFSVDDADGVAAAGPQHVSWTLANSADWYTVTAVFHTAAGP